MADSVSKRRGLAPPALLKPSAVAGSGSHGGTGDGLRGPAGGASFDTVASPTLGFQPLVRTASLAGAPGRRAPLVLTRLAAAGGRRVPACVDPTQLPVTLSTVVPEGTRRLVGPYELGPVIGQGSFATVYGATDTRTQEKVRRGAARRRSRRVPLTPAPPRTRRHGMARHRSRSRCCPSRS